MYQGELRRREFFCSRNRAHKWEMAPPYSIRTQASGSHSNKRGNGAGGGGAKGKSDGAGGETKAKSNGAGWGTKAKSKSRKRIIQENSPSSFANRGPPSKGKSNDNVTKKKVATNTNKQQKIQHYSSEDDLLAEEEIGFGDDDDRNDPPEVVETADTTGEEEKEEEEEEEEDEEEEEEEEENDPTRALFQSIAVAGAGEDVNIVTPRTGTPQSNTSSLTDDMKFTAICANANEQGSRGTDEDASNAVKNFIIVKVWPELKFLTSNIQLESMEQESLFGFVTGNRGLNIRPEARAGWWNKNKDTVHQCLRQKRGNVISVMKARFLSRCNLCGVAACIVCVFILTLISLQDILIRSINEEKERQSKDDVGEVTPKFALQEVLDIGHPKVGNNWKAYCWAVKQFMPTVVGKKKWNRNYMRYPLQNFVTVTGKSVGCST